MVDYEIYKEKSLTAAPELRKEYKNLENEFAIVGAILDARKRTGMTYKELARASGIPQADISRMENGNGNPSLRTLMKLADGLGINLKISFVPRS